MGSKVVTVMPSHSKLYTRHELNLLDTYTKGAKPLEIADKLGVSVSTVWRYLRQTGNNNLGHIKYAKPLPDDSELRCQECKILLSEAAAMDGAGSKTHCRFCLTVLAGHPWAQHLPVYGGDPMLKMIDVLAQVKHALDGHWRERAPQ
jgi:hypothetical protein